MTSPHIGPGHVHANYSTFNQVGGNQTIIYNNTTLIISPGLSRNRISVLSDTQSLPTYRPQTFQQGGHFSSSAVAIIGTVVGLIETITDELLVDSKQSSSMHRDLALELESLQRTLSLTRLAVQIYQDRPLGQSLANTITPEVLACLFTLQELLDHIGSTWLDLCITSASRFWRRIWGVRWDGDESTLLRKKLSSSRQSLQGLLMALHSYVLFTIRRSLLKTS